MEHYTSIRGWHRASLSPELLIVKSTLVEVPLHWLPFLNQHAKCWTSGCALCEHNIITKLHATVVVTDMNDRIWILELTEEHRGVCELLRCKGTEAIGCVLTVQRDPKDKLTRHISLMDERIRSKPIPCQRYIQAIGQRAYEKAVRMLSAENSSVDPQPET